MSYDAVSLVNRVARIAGRHRSHRFRRSPVGARLPAMNDDAVRLIDRVAWFAGKPGSNGRPRSL